MSHSSNEQMPILHKDWDHYRDKQRCDHQDNHNKNYLMEKPRPLLQPLDNIIQQAGSNTSANYPPLLQPIYSDMPQRPMRPTMNMHPGGYHTAMHRPPLFAQHPMPMHHAVGAHQQRMPMPLLNTYEQPFNPIGNMAPG